MLIRFVDGPLMGERLTLGFPEDGFKEILHEGHRYRPAAPEDGNILRQEVHYFWVEPAHRQNGEIMSGSGPLIPPFPEGN